MQELEVARRSAQAGSEIVAQYFREGITARQKDETDTYNLVSDADVESEKAIADVIRQAFPGHALLGEESHGGDVGAEVIVPQLFQIAQAHQRIAAPDCMIEELKRLVLCQREQPQRQLCHLYSEWVHRRVRPGWRWRGTGDAR